MVIRLLGLLAGLSAVTDLGTGAPLDEALRRCVVATRLARVLGCPDAEIREVVYASLLQHLGCTAFAHQVAGVFHDDTTAARLSFRTDFTRPADVWRTWVPGLVAGTGWSRARVIATTMVGGRRVDLEGPAATCDVARAASRRLGLPEAVQASLSAAFTMWNGRGYPRLRDEEIPRSTRLVHVASTAVLFADQAGNSAGVSEVERRSGSYLDPELARAFIDHSGELLEGLGELDPYQAVLDSEPDPVRLIGEEQLVEVARTFGDLVDLKSRSLHGHSAAVGDLAGAAAAKLRLADADDIGVAGYLHDLGRVGVSSRIWDKAGDLSRTERDQARLHPYYSEQILSGTPALTWAARLAGQHHERCDGSGYHRGLRAAQLTMSSRVLAAADAYRSLVEGRPHRPSVPTVRAANQLRADVRAGRLDADAVGAVLESAGHRAGTSRGRGGDLTSRQVEVLRLLAAGLSNREIARRLGISSRTAEHHVQDCYVRIGVSTRAGAALYAMEHGLLARSG